MKESDRKLLCGWIAGELTAGRELPCSVNAWLAAGLAAEAQDKLWPYVVRRGPDYPRHDIAKVVIEEAINSGDGYKAAQRKVANRMGEEKNDAGGDMIKTIKDAPKHLVEEREELGTELFTILQHLRYEWEILDEDRSYRGDPNNSQPRPNDGES